MRVQVTHPAPLLFVPARARKGRWAYGRAETWVEIPEIDPSAFRLLWRGAPLGMHGWRSVEGTLINLALPQAEIPTFEICERDGRIWVGYRPEDGSDAAGVLRACLTGENLDSPVAGLLARTPLLGVGWSELTQGTALDELQVRDIQTDLTEEVRDAVISFAASRIAVSGDRVVVKAWEPMLLSDNGGESPVRMEPYPGAQTREPWLFRLDGRGLRPDLLSPGLPTVPAEWLGDDDVVLGLNILIERYCAEVEQARANWSFFTGRGIITGTKAEADAALHWLKPAAMRAGLGLLCLSDAPQLLEHCAETGRRLGFKPNPGFLDTLHAEGHRRLLAQRLIEFLGQP